ncbi:hypothetical protein [Pseudomonas nitroreducens]|nr:hypothetical protein [Pseudomonas nitroreducens]MCP1650900.1 hypothetical protein [Pseudomonas nitroreducens]MCP1688852.1 hypothetical protein [Pseudomonas nitroreducens]
MRLALAVFLVTLVIVPLGTALILGWLPALAILVVFILALAWAADPSPI